MHSPTVVICMTCKKCHPRTCKYLASQYECRVGSVPG